MRLVIAILEPVQVEQARQALAGVQVSRMTICDTHAFPESLAQEAVVEIAVNDDFLARTLDTLATLITASGHDAQGRLRVLPIEEAVQIYRDVRGPEAI